MSHTPPLDQRSKRRIARTGIPQAIVRRDRAIHPAIAEPHPNEAPASNIVRVDTTSDDSDEGDDAPRTITTSVLVHTHGGELVKRPRPSKSSSGCSDEQEDKRVKLTRPALTLEIETAPDSPTLAQTCPQQPESPLRRDMPSPVAASSVISPTHLTSQSGIRQESASWPKDSTSYAGLASPVQQDVPMQPVSPQPSTSYAAAAAAPTSPRRSQPTIPHAVPADPTPRSAYPPLVVERLPNWTRHLQALGGILGHAPNVRPLGGGVRFLPKSAEEFRAVQRYLTTASTQDSTISWYCYSPAAEIPVKVAIRGLPLDTPTEAIVAALCARGFPAEAARAIPPPRGKHGCTYFVRLAHLTQEELQNLYAITELLFMPEITVEAWRGGQKPPQCYRCQQYSHSSANCHRPIRCVRCAGEHAVRDCPRPREELPTCANCGQGHAANDRRCTFFKKEARRRGIAQLPPPPRAKQRQRQQQRPTTGPAQPALPPETHQKRNVRPNADAAPPVEAPHEAIGATPMISDTINTPATRAPTVATKPTTLVAEANPPTIRGTAAQVRRRRRNKVRRSAQNEPAAASTPQQRQPGAGARDGAPSGPSTTPRLAPIPATTLTPPSQAPPSAPSQAPPSAPPTNQPTQGEAKTNSDVMAIVRVVVEALMTGLTAYLQGQGALAAGMAVLTRLQSC